MLRFATVLLLTSHAYSAQAQLGAKGAGYLSCDTLRAIFSESMANVDINSDDCDDAAASTGSLDRVTLTFGIPPGLDRDRVKVWTSELLGASCGGLLQAESMASGGWHNDGFIDLAVGIVDGLQQISSGDVVLSDRSQTETDFPFA